MVNWRFKDPRISYNARSIFERGEPVHSFSRPLLSGEHYSPMMLLGVEKIISLNGGTSIHRDPSTGISKKLGISDETSIYYLDGITVVSHYNGKFNSPVEERVNDFSFFARIYTPRLDWRNAPVILDLKTFFEISTPEQVKEVNGLLAVRD